VNDPFSLLVAAHVRAANRMEAIIQNMGWVATDNDYLSKTNKGILKTTRLRSGKYVHRMEAYAS
jgi:hypothetical protein